MEEGVKYVNFITEEQFVSMFGNVVEHTAQVAHNMFKLKPFRDSDSFLSTLDTVIDFLSHAEKVQILSGHPDLAGRLADSNLLTPESTREQREAGLDLLTGEEKMRLKSHNEKYRHQFGFTFIICARENKAAAILAGLDRRLNNSREKEIEIGIGEVKKIAKLRARDILDKCVSQSKL